MFLVELWKPAEMSPSVECPLWGNSCLVRAGAITAPPGASRMCGDGGRPDASQAVATAGEGRTPPRFRSSLNRCWVVDSEGFAHSRAGSLETAIASGTRSSRARSSPRARATPGGANWYGGLYAGKINGVHYSYDNSGSKGAKLRPLPSPDYFKYVHTPTLKMLDGKA